MADPDDGALRKELTREEARLADREIERARIARRIVELIARLSAGIPQSGVPQASAWCRSPRGCRSLRPPGKWEISAR